MKDSTIVVTGGCGYIGSHTLIQLVLDGYEVISIDNFSRSSPDNLKNIHRVLKSNSVKNINIDLKSRKDTFNFFSKISTPFSVIHFAAYKSVNESVSNPSLYYNNNVLSLINTLDAAIKYGAKSYL